MRVGRRLTVLASLGLVIVALASLRACSKPTYESPGQGTHAEVARASTTIAFVHVDGLEDWPVHAQKVATIIDDLLAADLAPAATDLALARGPQTLLKRLGFDPTRALAYEDIGFDRTAGLSVLIDERLRFGDEPSICLLLALRDRSKFVDHVSRKLEIGLEFEDSDNEVETVNVVLPTGDQRVAVTAQVRGITLFCGVPAVDLEAARGALSGLVLAADDQTSGDRLSADPRFLSVAGETRRSSFLAYARPGQLSFTRGVKVLSVLDAVGLSLGPNGPVLRALLPAAAAAKLRLMTSAGEVETTPRATGGAATGSALRLVAQVSPGDLSRGLIAAWLGETATPWSTMLATTVLSTRLGFSLTDVEKAFDGRIMLNVQLTAGPPFAELKLGLNDVNAASTILSGLASFAPKLGFTTSIEANGSEAHGPTLTLSMGHAVPASPLPHEPPSVTTAPTGRNERASIVLTVRDELGRSASLLARLRGQLLELEGSGEIEAARSVASHLVKTPLARPR